MTEVGKALLACLGCNSQGGWVDPRMMKLVEQFERALDRRVLEVVDERQAREDEEDERIHESALDDAYGPLGQG